MSKKSIPGQKYGTWQETYQLIISNNCGSISIPKTVVGFCPYRMEVSPNIGYPDNSFNLNLIGFDNTALDGLFIVNTSNSVTQPIIIPTGTITNTIQLTSQLYPGIYQIVANFNNGEDSINTIVTVQ